jgi:hypothetical protein
MNKLKRVAAEVRRLSSAEAELWIRIEAEQITPTTEVRGRIIGPRCPEVTTIEVAYPLRPFPRLPEGVPPLSRRVIIPEPSLWEAERPFVYRAIIELFQDGGRCDQTEFDVGMRMHQKATSPDTKR